MAALGAVLAAAGLLGLDPIVARWTATAASGETLWEAGTSYLDLVTLKPISNFLFGALLLTISAGLLIDRSVRWIGWPFLYVAAVHSAATVIADLSKPLFGRLRPFEAMASAGGSDSWFAGANSFPSGHEAFYAGLFLPLVVLFPRWWLALSVIPLFIAAARILAGDHYLSDVAASFALAALLAIVSSPILRNAGRPALALEEEGDA